MKRVDKFTEEEYEKIKSYVRENESPRNYLLVVLGYNLPLRISHLLELKVNEVRDDDGDIKREIYIEDWEDSIPIDDHSIQALEFYFDQVEVEQSDWLFSSHTHDQPINRTWTWRLINRWAESVGLEGQFGTDSLRKQEGVSAGSGTRDYYDIDTEVFDDLDNERSAYSLGLMATDGNIVPDVSLLRLTATDREMVENLKECLRTDKELIERKIEGQKTVYTYNTCNKKVIDGALKYIPAKSKDWSKISKPIKESPAVNHFVRGVIDGDGYVGEYNVVITGKKGVLEDLKDIIAEVCKVKEIDIRQKFVSEKTFNDENIYDLFIVGKDQVKRLYEWLYEDAQYYLTRKKKAMEENIITSDNNTSEYMDELWSE